MTQEIPGSLESSKRDCVDGERPRPRDEYQTMWRMFMRDRDVRFSFGTSSDRSSDKTRYTRFLSAKTGENPKISILSSSDGDYIFLT